MKCHENVRDSVTCNYVQLPIWRYGRRLISAYLLLSAFLSTSFDRTTSVRGSPKALKVPVSIFLPFRERSRWILSSDGASWEISPDSVRDGGLAVAITGGCVARICMCVHERNVYSVIPRYVSSCFLITDADSGWMLTPLEIYTRHACISTWRRRGV